MIARFRDEYAFLSNFHPCEIRMQGRVYPSVENAFQAAKVLAAPERVRFETLSPAAARSAGRRVALRAGWDEMRLEVMLRMLRMKFRRGSPLAAQLLATGDLYLEENNAWGDRFWGAVDGGGHNHLGRLLMRVRSELSAQVPPDRAPWE